jgi:hypothetical protein
MGRLVMVYDLFISLGEYVVKTRFWLTALMLKYVHNTYLLTYLQMVCMKTIIMVHNSQKNVLVYLHLKQVYFNLH